MAYLRNQPPPGVSPAELARAEHAADWLAEQATHAGGRVVVVTHATFRVVLARALVKRGWRGPRERSYREWSAWPFVPGAPPPAP
jgi:hypothetical protein